MVGKIVPGCVALTWLLLGGAAPVLAQAHPPAAGSEKAAHAAAEHEPLAALQEHAEAGHEEGGEEGGFIVRGEYLLMQPRRRAVDFALVSPINSGRPVGNVVEAPWEATSGLRAGLGYRLPSEGWEVGFEYTYLFTDSTRSVSAPPGGAVFATLSQPTLAVFAVDSAAASNSLLYNVLDVMIGRRFSVGESTSLWLGGGGRFAWMKQEFKVSYDGQTANQAQLSSPIDFDGGGVRVGGEGQWNVGKRLGLYARAFGSLVIGDFDTSLQETNGGGATTIVSLGEHYRKIVPVVELGVGLAWQTESFRFRIGYEITNWFGLVDSPDLVHELNKLSQRTSDLSLDGLAVSLQFVY